MKLVHSDTVVRVAPGTTPDYDRDNPLQKLSRIVGRSRLALGREHYTSELLQHLVPFDHLELWGPQAPNSDVLDPAQQDAKTDFQKQNVRDFHSGDTELVRGWAHVEEQAIPFLHLSYRGGPDSRLSTAAQHALSREIKLWLRVGGAMTPELVTVPYNPSSGRYELELWGAIDEAGLSRLDDRGKAARERGEIQVRPDLIRGSASDFSRAAIEERELAQIAPEHAMHPVLPLHVELAWADASAQAWDSQQGANYHYEFSMILRGWDHVLRVGQSQNPHGGVGGLEYRNLLTNYGGQRARTELGRALEPWNFDAFGAKSGAPRSEPFMAVDYMDLHRLHGGSGIGLHRHRDNQEAFLMMEGQGIMVVGDFCKMPSRERCFEVRTLRAGHLALLKGGNLHALLNPSDEELSLFMFGGYD